MSRAARALAFPVRAAGRLPQDVGREDSDDRVGGAMKYEKETDDEATHG